MTDGTFPAEFNDSRQAIDALNRPKTAKDKLYELYHVLRPAIEAAMGRVGHENIWHQGSPAWAYYEKIKEQDKALLRAGEILGVTESRNKDA